MRDFERASLRLRALPFHGKLVYGVFLGLTLVALGLTAALTHDMVGLDLGQLGSYYRGEVAPTAPSPEPTSGPAIEMPDDATAAPAATPMSRRKLLEVTHFHLFSMPVYLLILSHLFMLSGLVRARTKTAWILAGTVGTCAHVAAPWIAAHVPTIATPFYALSGLALAIPMVVMSAVPLVDLCLPAPPRTPSTPPTPT